MIFLFPFRWDLCFLGDPRHVYVFRFEDFRVRNFGSTLRRQNLNSVPFAVCVGHETEDRLTVRQNAVKQKSEKTCGEHMVGEVELEKDNFTRLGLLFAISIGLFHASYPFISGR